MESFKFVLAVFYIDRRKSEVMPGHGEIPALVIHLYLAFFAATRGQGAFRAYVESLTTRAYFGV
ncbi:MAG: hypothetical protein JRI59_10245 [Deltaproteobacteria bacterium]|nr:hypothetical protein [Deltaproteobacteria bacterium]